VLTQLNKKKKKQKKQTNQKTKPKKQKQKVRGGGGSSSPPFISHARFYMPPNHPSLFLRFEPRLREPPILPPAMPAFENVITTTTGKNI
jgi:hypothetical protein